MLQFDPVQEKIKVYDLLAPALSEEKEHRKQKYFKQATSIAHDEIDELQAAYQKFINSVEHLHVFKEIIREPLETNMSKIIRDLRFLIDKNYTKEELEQMPRDVYDQVLKAQKQRVDILKKIAKTYLNVGKKADVKE